MPIRMPSTISAVERSKAVSSMRSTKVAPNRFAKSQLNSAVRAPPTCRYPVGEGAKRTRIGDDFVMEAANLGADFDVRSPAKRASSYDGCYHPGMRLLLN